MYADFDLDEHGRAHPIGRGGAREGAGRKPAGYEKPKDVRDYERARALNEEAKAKLNDLDFKIKSGEYVSREAVQQAAATMLASIAQTLRSIPDTLERRLNLPPETLEAIGVEIDNVLEGLGDELRLVAGEI